MKKRYLTFFSSVISVAVFSVLTSWIIQSQAGDGINFYRAIFQIALAGLVLFLLWGRSTPGYGLAVIYVIGNGALYGYQLLQYYILGNQSAFLPGGAMATSSLLVISSLLAPLILGLDYIDYRKRRIPDSSMS